jgi:hypothetical protein
MGQPSPLLPIPFASEMLYPTLGDHPRMKLKHLIPEALRTWLYWRRAGLVALVKKAAHALGLSKLVWKMSLPSEVHFWDDYIRTRGKFCDAADEFAFRISPDSELQPWLQELLQTPEDAPLKFLDVGAGPLTWIGKKWGPRQIQINAIDPLAASYNKVLDHYGLTPPVRTAAIAGEDLLTVFPANSFDLAFARNSLDHSYDAPAGHQKHGCGDQTRRHRLLVARPK